MEKRTRSSLLGLLLLAALLLIPVAALGQPSPDEAQAVIAADAERFRALANRDMDAAERLHAEEFVQINPFGHEMSRGEFLRSVAAGNLVFLDAKTSDTAVRVYGDAAVLRQRSVVDAEVDGLRMPAVLLWEMALYERRDGQWQAVWAMASETR